MIAESRWTILHRTRSDDNGVYVLARCSCGTEREVLRSSITRGLSRSCGCQRMSPVTRFMKYVPKGGADECWEWQSTRNHRGYGKFWLNGRTDLAHRVAYQIANGEQIPPGLLVRHTCDNPPCVNPRHLLLGTALDNSADQVERGRSLRGVANYRAKLTDAQVLEIRRRLSRGETQTSLAAEFGVSTSAVQFIACGRNWAHVKEAS